MAYPTGPQTDGDYKYSPIPWLTFQEVLEEEFTPEGPSVAEDILDSFGIEFSNTGGGNLKNVDIKRGDAFSVLKASLLETFAQDSTSPLTEIRINPDGEAEFYEVGGERSDIRPYYTISSSTFIKDPNKVGVMVTGGKPKQSRYVYNWHQVIGPTATNTSTYDTSSITDQCLSDSLSTHVTITYHDPLRTNPNNSFNDGVEDLFDLPDMYTRFIGYTWRIIPPSFASIFAKITPASQSSIPVLLGDINYRIGQNPGHHPNFAYPPIGKPEKKKTFTVPPDSAGTPCTPFDSEIRYCEEGRTVPLNIAMAEGLTYKTTRGIRVSKFLGIAGLYVVGVPLIACYGIPKPGLEKAENTVDNTALFVAANTGYNSLIKLSEGIHYVVSYIKDLDKFKIDDNTAPEEYLPCIQFINNLKPNDHALVKAGMPFYVGSYSKNLLARVQGKEITDLPTGGITGEGTVLPFENRSGVLIEQLWAQINLDTSCFIISDPLGNAKDIADELIVEVMPLAITDYPPPMALNGTIIDQSQGAQDNDPTTGDQNFDKTEMELAQETMSSGRTLSLNFASLDEEQTKNLSKKLYNILKEDTGETYTHTCSPEENPKVGDIGPNGYIINSIEYSFTDRGTYLITVNEGPVNFGDFAGISGGLYYKRTEEVTTRGTVILDKGNHVDYVVRVDGIGDVRCINGCAQVINIRDRVSITIHNNAVED